MDGTQWQLKLKLANKKLKKSSGSNAYPDKPTIDSTDTSSEFEALLKLLKEMIGRSDYFV